jgi:5-methylcytosine-specific restriction endonuclease McrA
MDRCLLLNADHQPIKTICWQRAVSLLVQDRVVLVAEFEGAVVRSPSLTVPRPAVVALTTYVRLVRPQPAPSRRNVLARDGYRCVYCNAGHAELAHLPPEERLTMDHVVPRSSARNGRVKLPWNGREVPVGSWENLVTACRSCNGRKGAMLPREAGLTLRKPPRTPDPRDIWLTRLRHGSVSDPWLPWVERRRAA